MKGKISSPTTRSRQEASLSGIAGPSEAVLSSGPLRPSSSMAGAVARPASKHGKRLNVVSRAWQGIAFATIPSWADHWLDATPTFQTRWLQQHDTDALNVLRKPVRS